MFLGSSIMLEQIVDPICLLSEHIYRVSYISFRQINIVILNTTMPLSQWLAC